MINLIFDIDDTVYDQLKPFENAFKTVFGKADHLKIENLYIKVDFIVMKCITALSKAKCRKQQCTFTGLRRR